MQSRLWDDYSWPFLRVRRDINLQDGQRYYDPPVDMVFEQRVERVEFKHGDIWEPMSYGIGREQYNQYDSDRDIRSWPVYRYDNYETTKSKFGQFQTKIRKQPPGAALSAFMAFAILAHWWKIAIQQTWMIRLITLYAAAQFLVRQRQADAGGKLQEANAHYMRLKARLSKTDTFVIGAETSDEYCQKGRLA